MHDALDLDALVVNVRVGDHRAFASLYDALAPRVFGVVARIVRDPAMSEEVTQEVFVELWRKASRYDPTRASVTGWATMIARRRAIDRVRAEQSRRDAADAAAAVPDDPEPVPLSVIDRDEAARVRAALAALPDGQRDVIRLAFLDGRTHQDIAEALEIPLGTVKGRVRLGLARLRAGLETTDER